MVQAILCRQAPINHMSEVPTVLWLTRARMCLRTVRAGHTRFQALVVASDSDDDYPVPDGETRQHLAEFGTFPVFLVNRKLEIRTTSTQELYPLQATSKHRGGGVKKRDRSPDKSAAWHSPPRRTVEEEVVHLHR